MATMYHCEDASCQDVRATHYCAKQNQPRMLANLSTTNGNIAIFDCDMSTALCQSKEDHVHRITHELSDDGNMLKTTYSSWKGGKHSKNSMYKFVRK